MANMRQPSLFVRRPGLVTFAGVMMFILGGFQLIIALQEFADVDWLAWGSYGVVGGSLWWWGFIDLAVAAGLLYAGYDILNGGEVGRTIGIVIGGISSLRWFFYLPYTQAPFVSMLIIAANVVMIYGLVAHGEFFSSQKSP